MTYYCENLGEKDNSFFGLTIYLEEKAVGRHLINTLIANIHTCRLLSKSNIF